jgi:predicted metal-dependent hydrolase
MSILHTITLGSIEADVELKDIKNIHLSVYPPTGRVRIAAPIRMDLDTIRIFAISKLSWIKKQQEKLRSQLREAPRDFLTRESHYFLGKRYLMEIVEKDAKPKVTVNHDTLVFQVRPNTSTEQRQVILQEWYRTQLKMLLPALIAQWEKKMKVSIIDFGIKKMKTKWGTCNIEAKRIWLNLELAKKPIHCIEYILVHEMVHLLERRHNDRFIQCMNQFYPQWRVVRDELNSLALGVGVGK